MSLWLSGIGVSRGVAIGQVQRMHGADLEVPEYQLPDDQVGHEITRFYGAQQRAREQLSQVRSQIPAGTPAEIAAFIDTHLLMIDDRSLNDAVVNMIRDQRCNAEQALVHQRDALIAVFDQMDDPYLKTRRDDIEHVTDRILRVLMKSDRELPARSGAAQATIIVADDITPADIILLGQQDVVAFITEYGGPLSHTAILARSMGIPAIVGLHNARRLLRDGEALIVDGDYGHALASPDERALEHYRGRQQRAAENLRKLSKLKDEPAISTDGVKITLLANIELPEEAAAAAEQGAEGVGLYRTEFLFMNRKTWPTEDEQYAAYAKVVKAVKGPITIRTLDLGADKQVDSGRSLGPTPNNPALGLRAIRLCLREPELFRGQLRALLRAAQHGQVKIMLPMISSVQEFRQAQQLIRDAQASLRQAGVLDGDVDAEIGAMIEVPAAALGAKILGRHASFFSIGTNDLIQYTLAIDRVDDEVNYLYDPLHPAVLQLIQMTIAAGEANQIPVAMCGEMAGDARFTRLLLGLGLTEFSMHPSSLLEVKRIIIESDVAHLRTQARELLMASSQSEFRERIASLVEA